jgi:hypothetical protein
MSGSNGGLTIGGIDLSDFASPSKVPWGTKQLIKEHVYPGGQNVLQAMGPINEPMTWTGQILGPDATTRAGALDTMAASGQIQELSFGSLNFDVMVERFVAEYQHEWWTGSYTITVRPQWDYQQTPDTTDPATAAGNDLGNAANIVPTISAAPIVASAQSALAVVQTSAQSALAVVQTGTATVGALTAAGAAINNAVNWIGVEAVRAGVVLTGTASPASILNLSSAAGTLAMCAAAFGYTARAAINFGQVPGIASPTLLPQQVQPDMLNYAP